MRNQNEGKRKQVNSINDGLSIESEYNNRSSEIDTDGRRISNDNQLFGKKQKNNRRSSDETIHVADSRLGQGVNNSLPSF